MRIWVPLAAVWAITPLLGQQSGAQGVGNEKRMQDAVRNAFENTLRFPAPTQIRTLPLIKPKKFYVDLRVPAEMCTVPLLEVPALRDPDAGSLLTNGDSSADNKMLVPPAVGVCPPTRRE